MLTKAAMSARLDASMRPKLQSRSEAMQEYYSVLMASDFAPGTIRNYMQTLLRFDNYARENYCCTIEDLPNKEILDYLRVTKNVVGSDGNVRPASNAHQASIWSALNRYYEFLVATHRRQDHPLRLTKKPKQNKDRVKRYFFTPSELQLLIDKAYSDIDETAIPRKYASQVRNYAVLVLLCYSGMRIGAALNIDVGDVNWENRTVEIAEKRDHSYTHHLGNKEYEALCMCLEARGIFTICEDTNPALFLSKGGHRLKAQVFSRWLEKMETALIGDKHLAPHKLRASFATNLSKATNGNVRIVQKALHHTKAETTELYLVDDEDANQAAGDVMSKLLG